MSRSAHALAFAPPEAAADSKRDLIGLSRDALTDAVVRLGEPKFRAKQLWHWLYHQGATDFAAMTTLSKGFRAKLAEHFRISRPGVARHQVSEDGTQKWLLRFDDGNEAEMVFIPEEDRGTLCVSSQVGCTLTCRFCHTGTQRLVRNLLAAEILGQILLARDFLGEWPSPKEGRRLTNIVMMGMGEPLYNFEEVSKALKLAMDPDGVALSRRRITLSTSGVVPMMARCGEELGVNLAVSLHATNDELRDEIVPLNRKYPIAELLQACRDYPGVHNARRITFEYVMLKDVNDSDVHADELARLLRDIPAKVNLIPFNPWPGTVYECSDWNRIETFSDRLYHHGLSAPVRRPRGRDIAAACGQLKSASERLRKSEREAAAVA
ncbi:23S rRNA (adenine(2503)-C(2))-methyltransferase RlmN [Aquibaculum arenosum]|uniref:Dual-specificity RNA methyltransferase RlmN n=1 Tax=Aquibaculum arenosum TaxID=3032591 RepID=A0ABT5YI58_9PROT|nr:23S rRNA (adenine(2503)-C(2))-methyltransferase RlmN [Fodinicurvata sp. CAU 1616]MDF2094626.1 23S rRNA (adenine(2503)-C(2))-methyltransferase RlmN [Fodinicurvata sp. CAU 1616]